MYCQPPGRGGRTRGEESVWVVGDDSGDGAAENAGYCEDAVLMHPPSS